MTIRTETEYSLRAVAFALNLVTRDYLHKGYLWYMDPYACRILMFAVSKGWAFRQSTTQAGWTQAGVDAYHQWADGNK